MHISKVGYPVTLLSPPRRLAPSLGLGTTWVRQPRSGSCHYPTAATKCDERPSQATANPVSGKACSSTKGGLLRYIFNTYSIHKVSSLKFAYFQGRLSRHTCFGARASCGTSLHYVPLRTLMVLFDQNTFRLNKTGLHMVDTW